VLEQFHRMLRRREIFAKNSSKWGAPRAKLLDGEVWEQAKPTMPASLGLPEDSGEYLAARAALPHPFVVPVGNLSAGDGGRCGEGLTWTSARPLRGRVCDACAPPWP
jgi:hypothetical protein